MLTLDVPCVPPQTLKECVFVTAAGLRGSASLIMAQAVVTEVAMFTGSPVGVGARPRGKGPDQKSADGCAALPQLPFARRVISTMRQVVAAPRTVAPFPPLPLVRCSSCKWPRARSCSGPLALCC